VDRASSPDPRSKASLTSIGVSSVGDPLVAVAHADSSVSVIIASSGARVAREPVPGKVTSAGVRRPGPGRRRRERATAVRLFPRRRIRSAQHSQQTMPKS